MAFGRGIENWCCFGATCAQYHFVVHILPFTDRNDTIFVLPKKKPCPWTMHAIHTSVSHSMYYWPQLLAPTQQISFRFAFTNSFGIRYHAQKKKPHTNTLNKKRRKKKASRMMHNESRCVKTQRHDWRRGSFTYTKHDWN